MGLRLRVLHLYGGGLAYGGVERLLFQLARYREHAPELVQDFGLCYPGRLAQELQSVGVTAQILGPAHASRPWQVSRQRRQLQQRIEKSYDLVLCHAWWTHAIFGSAVRKAGIPLGLFVHNHVTGRGWLEAWARLTRPDFAIAHTAAIASSVRSMYTGLPAMLWLPPVAMRSPLPAEQREGIRAQLATPSKELVILQASRLEAWKGHRLLLESMAIVKLHQPATLWFAGGPQLPEERRYYASLQQAAGDLGVADRVRWLGKVGDMGEFMSAADIYCQPNTAPEPFGTVFVEAMASGLPIVTTRGGGPDGFVTGTCGTLVGPSVAEVTAALGEFLGDAERRSAAAIAARARVRELFDPATQMRALQETLQEALGVRT